MRLVAGPRWAVSFADLALLLLGCFVMLHALRPATAPAPSVGRRADDLVAELRAEDLFEPGEARMTAAGLTQLSSLAERLGGARVVLDSRGGAWNGGTRLDAFELAAARAAAVARALGGEGRATVAMAGPGQRPSQQWISVRTMR